MKKLVTVLLVVVTVLLSLDLRAKAEMPPLYMDMWLPLVMRQETWVHLPECECNSDICVCLGK